MFAEQINLVLIYYSSINNIFKKESLMMGHLTSERAIERDISLRIFMDLSSHSMETVHPAKPWLWLLIIYN